MLPGSPSSAMAAWCTAVAPLGVTLLMEFAGAAAGSGRSGRPSFFIEAHGEPVRGRLHIALRADNRPQVDAFHAAAIEAGGTDNGAPGARRCTTPTTAARTSSTPTAQHRSGLPPARVGRPPSRTSSLDHRFRGCSRSSDPATTWFVQRQVGSITITQRRVEARTKCRALLPPTLAMRHCKTQVRDPAHAELH